MPLIGTLLYYNSNKVRNIKFSMKGIIQIILLPSFTVLVSYVSMTLLSFYRWKIEMNGTFVFLVMGLTVIITFIISIILFGIAQLILTMKIGKKV